MQIQSQEIKTVPICVDLSYLKNQMVSSSGALLCDSDMKLMVFSLASATQNILKQLFPFAIKTKGGKRQKRRTKHNKKLKQKQKKHTRRLKSKKRGGYQQSYILFSIFILLLLASTSSGLVFQSSFSDISKKMQFMRNYEYVFNNTMGTCAPNSLAILGAKFSEVSKLMVNIHSRKQSGTSKKEICQIIYSDHPRQEQICVGFGLFEKLTPQETTQSPNTNFEDIDNQVLSMISSSQKKKQLLLMNM